MSFLAWLHIICTRNLLLDLFFSFLYLRLCLAPAESRLDQLVKHHACVFIDHLVVEATTHLNDSSFQHDSLKSLYASIFLLFVHIMIAVVIGAFTILLCDHFRVLKNLALSLLPFDSLRDLAEELIYFSDLNIHPTLAKQEVVHVKLTARIVGVLNDTRVRLMEVTLHFADHAHRLILEVILQHALLDLLHCHEAARVNLGNHFY